ncbi:MAG: hypothetical protein JNM43_26325 [Planctomycetaceae bacterium]|nr:hypothetical protein [Planctomycetaceae bacterium]
MSSTAPVSARSLLAPEHLRSLLAHIDAEEVSLRNILRLLQDMPTLADSDARQREIRLRIEQSMQHIALLTQNRHRVIQSLAHLLGIAEEDLSLSILIPHANEAARSMLSAARTRLQRLIRQVQTLAQSVGWIVAETRRIHFAIIDSLPGTTSSDRYDASGQRHLNPASLRFGTRS